MQFENQVFLGRGNDPSSSGVFFRLNEEKEWLVISEGWGMTDEGEQLSASFTAKFCPEAPLDDLLKQWRAHIGTQLLDHKYLHISTIEPLEFPLNTHCPRIDRPMSLGFRNLQNPLHANYTNEISLTLNDLHSLQSQIIGLCEYVTPKGNNLSATGSRISQIVINLCIVFESQCSQILKENGICQDRYTTKDFVKLLSVMRLNEYTFSSARYPGLDDITPFGDWNETNPTASIEWFRRYNKAKHERSNTGQNPRFLDVFHAFAACLVIFDAQFLRAYISDKMRTEIDILKMKKGPRWKGENCYFLNSKFDAFTPVGYFQSR